LSEIEILRYQDFLAWWKDADLDVPVLKQAGAEIREVTMKLQ
jgi:hypothetical protein